MMHRAGLIKRRLRALSFASMLPAVLVVLVIAATPLATRAAGNEPEPDGHAATTSAEDDLVRAGADVYELACSACHQPGGAGLASQFPPLVNNPSVDDADYIETVIRNGLDGEIVVNGVTFDNLMPPQSTLGDEDIEAVIAYVQAGFVVPVVESPEFVDGGDSSSGLSDGIKTGLLIGVLLAVVAAAFLRGPQIVAAHDRREITWGVAWGKTALIVVALILVTTLIPSWVLESGPVQDLSRDMRDLVTVAVWGGGVTASIFGLWYAHRKRRI